MSRSDRRFRTAVVQRRRMRDHMASWVLDPFWVGSRTPKIIGKLRTHNVTGTWDRHNNDTGERRHRWQIVKAKAHASLAEVGAL
jgi:hypothetical protein